MRIQILPLLIMYFPGMFEKCLKQRDSVHINYMTSRRFVNNPRWLMEFCFYKYYMKPVSLISYHGHLKVNVRYKYEYIFYNN